MGDARSLRKIELKTLSDSLACILQEENPLPPPEHEAREAELSRRLSPRSSNGSPSPGLALHSQDISIISRLLNQVHQLMAEEDGGEILMQPKDNKEPDSIDPQVATQKNMVEAVVEVAGAAAAAAKAAAASSGKNLEVMETLLSDYENDVQQHRPAPSEDQNEGARDKKAHEDESSPPPVAVEKDVVKRLERQNRITHWVLGFTIVATAIWRWKVLTTILGVQRTFTNPFQALGGMVSEGFKGGNKDDPANGTKGVNKARPVLPSILGGEEKIMTNTEKTEHSSSTTEHSSSTTEDFKIGEVLTQSLGNLLPSDKLEGQGGEVGGHESEGTSKEVSSRE